jgi:hypothetical protein
MAEQQLENHWKTEHLADSRTHMQEPQATDPGQILIGVDQLNDC